MKTYSKRLLAILLALMMILSFAACDKKDSPVGEKEGESIGEDEKALKAGKYIGEAEGLNGPIKVEVELDEKEIKAIEILDHKETEGIADGAIENIPKRIVENQSIKIDTISGATYTSKGILEAVEKALKEAGADIEQFMKDSEADDKEGETIDKEADVAIIGAGGAGLAAAVSALENDAKVIILDKMPSVGGSTIIAGGQYNAVDAKRQGAQKMRPELIKELESYVNEEPVNETHKRLIEELKVQIEDYKKSGEDYIFDSPQLHALQAFKGGDQVGNLDLIEELTRGAEKSVAWLEKHGVEFRDEIATVTGALWPRTHQFVKPLVTGPIDAYKEFIKSKDDKAELMLETTAKELIIEDGKVVGVKAEQGKDKINIKAKSVVIATGGFARNPELIEKYDSHWGGLEKLGSTNSVSATGDGIVMAFEAKAKLTGMEYIQLLPVGDPVTGGMQGNISINAANQLFVNIEGNRFVAEDERRDVLTKGLMEQPEKTMFILHDAHEYTDESVKNDFNEAIGDLVKAGTVVKGETIEELAKNMGVDANNLKKTVDEYNQAVAGKTKDKFGKKLLEDPFDKAPFYASKRVPTIHHTMGGLEIDRQARVIGENGKPIVGLYAAGEVTGGIHGANRLGGNAIPETVVFGNIAGESAAKGK